MTLNTPDTQTTTSMRAWAWLDGAPDHRITAEKDPPPLLYVHCACGQITCTRHPRLLAAQGWLIEPDADPKAKRVYQDGEHVHGSCPACHERPPLVPVTCCRCSEPVVAIPRLLRRAGWQVRRHDVRCPRCKGFVVRAKKAHITRIGNLGRCGGEGK